MDADAPIPVLHPVAADVRLRGRGAVMRRYLGVRTPIRLGRLPRDAFAPLPQVRLNAEPPQPFGIPATSKLAGPPRPPTLPEAPHLGPGGLWTPVRDAHGLDVPPGAFAVWLGGGTVPEPMRLALDARFGGTPLATRRIDWTGTVRSPHHACRGDRDRGGESVVLRDDRQAAAAALAGWMARAIALAEGRVMARWRPYLTWRVSLNWPVWMRHGPSGCLGDLPISPASWPAVAALHRAVTGEAVRLDERDWLGLAPAWPDEPDGDLRQAAACQAHRLMTRIRDRLRQVRARAPDDPRLGALGRALPALDTLSRRADLGLAGHGAEGAAELEAFRSAVLLEAEMAGPHADRTGIRELRAFVVDIADRSATVPDGDAAALSDLAP